MSFRELWGKLSQQRVGALGDGVTSRWLMRIRVVMDQAWRSGGSFAAGHMVAPMTTADVTIGWTRELIEQLDQTTDWPATAAGGLDLLDLMPLQPNQGS